MPNPDNLSRGTDKSGYQLVNLGNEQVNFLKITAQ